MPIGGMSWEDEERPEVSKEAAEAGQPAKAKGVDERKPGREGPHKRAYSYVKEKKGEVEKLKEKYLPGLIGEVFTFLFAFLLAYLFIQGLGFVLNTSSPLVVVESESMVHGEAWQSWPASQGLSPGTFGFGGGMGIGDIILVKGDDTDDINVGDVIVYSKLECGRNAGGEPIIHRVVGIVDIDGDDVAVDGAVKYEDGIIETPCTYDNELGYPLEKVRERFADETAFKDFDTDRFRLFITKGDNNQREDQCLRTSSRCEVSFPVHEKMVIGTAKFDIPYLGYVKLGLVCGLNFISGNACPARCWWSADHPRCQALGSNGW